jgi:tRNA threonylcarbamoyladenosine biosynthesis protein TsaE
MKTFESHSLEETKKIAGNWLAEVARSHSNENEALIVGLSGHLGAGKTAFIKLVAQELGVAETVTSPTFVLMKIYELTPNAKGRFANFPWKRLIHIDAYRLEQREELEALRWEDLMADKNNLIMIEWPENVGLTEFSEKAALFFEICDGVYSITIK